MSTSSDRRLVPLDGAPIYAVLFEGTDDAAPYLPLVAAPYRAGASVTVPHGLDREVVAALPGLWYCLHLPNTFFELIDISPAHLVMSQSLDLGHHILLMPIAAFTEEYVGPLLRNGVPVLAVCPDELLAETTERCAQLDFRLSPTSYSGLSSGSVEEHWRAIYELVDTKRPYLGRVPRLSRRLESAAADLPRRRLARQFDDAEEIRSETDSSEQDDVIYRALDAQMILGVIARMVQEGDDFEPGEAALAEERSRRHFPVTIASPGVAPTYVNSAYDLGLRTERNRDRSTAGADMWTTAIEGWNDASAELSAIRFLATHRAMAHAGIGITLPPIGSSAFGLLAQLEAHMQTPRPTGRAVARLLDRLAASTEHLWTPAVTSTVARASSLTVLSNFPIGLLRLPGDSAPIAARLPVTYRPLLPLTRAVQAELTYVPRIDLSGRMQVLVAECIPGSDPVGALSRLGWATALERLASDTGERMVVDCVETLSAEELRAAIDAYRPHILVISAHGEFTGNAAGLSIGGRTVLGPELGSLPPVVILSACSTAPRGAGTISVADLLLRQGAIAVLGTQVPVNVRRNTILTARFLVNIAEVLAERGNFGDSLLEVWHHVQSGNAVNDILSGNSMLEAWGASQGPSGQPVLVEFMLERSAGRLSAGDIYSATETVLGEIADDMEIGDKVRNWFRNPGYVPESLFYAFAGSPDRVHLRAQPD
jgi:hypothetical protein